MARSGGRAKGELFSYIWIILSLLTLSTVVSEKTVLLNNVHGGVPTLGGYVVPLNGSITLKCQSTAFHNGIGLRWNITLGNSSHMMVSSRYLSQNGQGKYSVPDGLRTENPTILKIHTLQLHENGSTVLCGVPSQDFVHTYREQSPSLQIFVEDVPQCPTTINIVCPHSETGCILWTHADKNLLRLPVFYTLSLSKLNGGLIFSQNTSQVQFDFTGRGIPPNTNYTVTVVACTRAGCSQNCNHTWISIPSRVSESGTDTQGTAGDYAVPSGNSGIIAVIVVCIVVGIGIMITVVTVSWYIVWKWKSKKDQHSVDGIVPEQTLKNSNDGVLGEYAKVTDVVKNHHLHSPPDKSIPTSCSHHSNVTDTEGYGTVQNAATSPQKVRNEGSFKQKPAVPISLEYSLVNHNTNCQTSTHVEPIAHIARHSLTGSIAAPSEYAQVPDSIKMKPPIQRAHSIPTPCSVTNGTPLPPPPPLPPRGSKLSPESPDVIDAGYASLPHNNKSGKITKVRPSKRGSSGDGIHV